jgi:hypothetical protein
MKGDFLRVGMSRQPAKSPRGINGALDRCASPCSQMAKVERGETVWKIGMGCEVGVPDGAKRGRKSPDRALFAAREARLRGLRPFSKQFRKVNSANFVCSIVHRFH